MTPRPLTDKQRIRAILGIMIEAFEDFPHLTPEAKLWYMIQPQDNLIYRRKVLQPIKLAGLWWIDDEQICKYLWHGHSNATIIKSDGPDKVYITRNFGKKDGWCYVRANQNGTYDLESMCYTSVKHPKTLKFRGAMEWMTVTISEDIYKEIDKYLGPMHDGCNHAYERGFF